MIRHRILLGTVSAVAALGPLLVAAPGQAAPTAATTAPSRVVAIRAAHHHGFDRLVFQFRGGLPAQLTVHWVKHVVADGSGKPVHVRGTRFVAIRFSPATAVRKQGTPTPATVTPLLPNLRQVKRTGDFEDVLSYAAGLRHRVHLHVFTLQRPSRVVIDIPD